MALALVPGVRFLAQSPLSLRFDFGVVLVLPEAAAIWPPNPRDKLVPKPRQQVYRLADEDGISHEDRGGPTSIFGAQANDIYALV